MNSYRITFNMTAPIALNNTVMFDSLIAWAYFQEVAPQAERTIGALSFDNVYDFADLPIAKHPDGYHIASWMYYEAGQTESSATFLKKWDEQYDYMADFGKSSRAVHVDRGQFKTTQIPLRTINPKRVWFYFQSDDVKAVQGLIESHIVGIGKKVSRGYGFYESFVIDECDPDIFQTSIYRPIKANQAMIDSLKGGASFEYRAWKMPYWLPGNFALCRVR